MNNKSFESLLLYKYQLEKEALASEREYYFIFGEELSLLTKTKIEVAILKRKIAYCQRLWNQGNPPSFEELENNCSLEFEEYLEYNRLLDKVDEAKDVHSSPRLSLEKYQTLQTIFRKLMKFTHPDIHPERQEDSLCQEIYQKAIEAYKNNNLDEIGRLYALALLHFQSKDVKIDNLKEKSAKLEEEIKEIIENKPYTYRYILESPEKIKEEHEQNKKDIEDYSYLKGDLELRLSTLLPGEKNQA